jgi:exodeoxyribonuclease VII small subunit
MAEKKKMSFEEAMEKLEGIVSRLESEKLSLDKALKLYEEGIGLAAKCASELEDAKRRIKILQQGKDGEIEIADVPEGTFTD